MADKIFSPENDIPSLTGKVIFVTGGTAGLGKETVLALAAHSPSHIYFTGRSQPRANELIALLPNTPLTFIESDLTSLSSVSSAAKTFHQASSTLDLLICNAGIMDAPPGLTQDGYEIHFGTNHLSHALLVKLLLPTMLQTAERKGKDADARIVFLTSIGFKNHPKGGIQFCTLKTPQTGVGWRFFRYGQSKLANILYAAQLARRYPSILSVSVHPGVVNTTLVSGLGTGLKTLVYLTNLGKVKTPKEGAWNQLWAATTKREEIVNGEYYEPVGIMGAHARESRNMELAERLWSWTQGELKWWEG
ncbi:MAG: hypothetical protein M1812_003129 [Candelaria pacifica]|nr:MAG: hypothetical protein M1812_003129 [Candelaria pacifica]